MIISDMKKFFSKEIHSCKFNRAIPENIKDYGKRLLFAIIPTSNVTSTVNDCTILIRSNLN